MEQPNIFSPEFAIDPYAVYKVMRNDFPLYFDKQLNSYVLSRYEDVNKAFTNKAFSTQNYEWQLQSVYGGKTVLQMDGKEHSNHRKILNAAFRGKELFQSMFIPVIESTVKELIENFPKDQDTIDLSAQFTASYPISVIVQILGLPKSDLPNFEKWYTGIVDFLANIAQDPDIHATGMQTKEELLGYLYDVVPERRKNPREDLLSVLCQTEIDGVQMTDQEIVTFCALLLVAGAETTDTAIVQLFKNLINHPEQMKAVREDRSLIDRAFAETLRFSPPVHLIMRHTVEDVEVSGGIIPANSTVTCLLGAANHDEEQYKNPAQFNIFREEVDAKHSFTGAAHHMAFGSGRHFCVGSLLAKAEGNIAANQLLDHFEDLQFRDGVAPPDKGLFLRTPDHLHLKVKRKEMVI